MTKLILWIMMLVVLTTSVFATVTMQYGTDNITWTNVSTIIENNRSAIQIALDSGKVYYFRAMDANNTWGYASTKTKEGTEQEMASLSVTIIYVFLTALFAIIMVLVRNNYWRIILSIPLMIFVSAILRLAGAFIKITYPTEDMLISMLDTFYSISVGFIYPIVAISVVITIYLIVKGMISLANKNRKEEYDE